MNSKPKSFGKKKSAMLASLALACVMALSGFTVSTLGVSAATGTEQEAGKWYTDFGTYEEELESAGKFNEKIMEEGAVLLKNNGVLPLANSVKNVSLFGARSFDPVTGGTGSGGGGGVYVSLTESMEEAGFNVNGKLKTAYGNNLIEAPTYSVGYKAQTVESPVSILNSVAGSYSFYGDAAIITIGRIGGEGDDLYVSNLLTHEDKSEHYLQLDDNEKDLIAHVKQNFDKVIVLLNTGNPMEIGELEDDPDIDAILWIGQPGNTGLKAIPRILKGEVNPSGKLVDIYTRDFSEDPTWQNFGTLAQLNDIDPVTGEYEEVYSTHVYYMNEDGERVMVDLGSPMFSAETIEYEENIYLGYKYYETAYAEANAGNYDGFNYDDQVVYPFGYGLSYTSFTQEFVTTAEEFEAAVNAASGLDDKVQVKVRVTNTGNVPGKEVVQLYIHAPYTEGGIEKAEVALVGYGKTDMLDPQESCEVTVDVRMGDIASFDYNDANDNDYKGWEIEAGDYELRLQEDSHTLIAKLDATLTAKTTSLDNDADPTNNTPLSEGDDFDSLLNMKSKDVINGQEYFGSMKLMSRADFAGTFPTGTKKEDATYSKHVADMLTLSSQEAGSSAPGGSGTAEGRYSGYYNSSDDLTTDPWYKTNEDIPDGWTQITEEELAERTDGKTDIQLREMAGIDYLDTSTPVTLHGVQYASGQAAWDAFMNQLTFDEMATVLSEGTYKEDGLDSIGKDPGKHDDGPAQMADGTFWCCEVVIGSTWNTELAYEQGVYIGNESLFQDVPCWYGPGLNIHRSPLSGRNFEYYSQDALQGGLLAAAVVAGAQTKGVTVYMKHFVLNDQEKFRGGLATFASEQAIRENYLKTFEYATKDGGANAVMTAFNRIGAMNLYTNYPLLVTILREEWGFKGTVITDFYQSSLAKGNLLIRGGCNRPMGTYSGQNILSGEWDASLRNGKGGVRDGNVGTDGRMPESPTQYYWVRQMATGSLWVAANTNINENCLDKSVFNYSEGVEWYAGIDGGMTGITPASFAIDTEKFGTEDIVYTVEGLPEGLTVSSQGELTGTTMETGSYEVTVSIVADGWSKVSTTATLNIVSLYSADKAFEAKAGEAYSAKITQDMFELGDMWDGGPVDGITYSITNNSAVPGLTLGSDGTLSGTPTTPGVYTMTVRTTLSYIRMRPRTASFDSIITFAVMDAQGNLPEEPKPVAEPDFRVEGGKLQYSADEGETWLDVESNTEALGIQSVTKDSVDGTKVTYTIIYTDGSTSTFTVTDDTVAEPAEGGCGSSVGTSALVCGAALVVMAAVILARRARRKND